MAEEEGRGEEGEGGEGGEKEAEGEKGAVERRWKVGCEEGRSIEVLGRRREGRCPDDLLFS